MGVLWLIYFTLHWIRLGTTVVELSNGPLSPGEEFQVLVRHDSRPAGLNCLQVELMWEETERRGRRRRTHVLHQAPLGFAKAADAASRRLEVDGKGVIPEGALSSGVDGSREVRWLIRVTGRYTFWLDYIAEFPLTVRGSGPAST